MPLYKILKDRAAVNMLKILHDKEVSEKKYAISRDELRKLSDVAENGATFENLEESGLISSESDGNGSMVMSITQKGKEFVAQFDKLRAVLVGEQKKHRAYQIKYDLTPLEQKILVMCSRVKSETGRIVPSLTLAQEVYPYDEAKSRVGVVSRYAKTLEELNLLIRIRDGDGSFFDVTRSGERAVKEQFLEAPMP